MSKKEPVPTKSKKLTVPEIIEYCKNELGITFNLMDEEKAKEFLKKNNFLLPTETLLLNLYRTDKKWQIHRT